MKKQNNYCIYCEINPISQCTTCPWSFQTISEWQPCYRLSQTEKINTGRLLPKHILKVTKCTLSHIFQPTNKNSKQIPLAVFPSNLMLQQWPPLVAPLVPPKVVRKALVVLGDQRGPQYAKWSGSQMWSHDCRNQVQASGFHMAR